MGTTSASTHLQELVKREKAPHCIVITCPDGIRRERALAFILEKLCPRGVTVASYTFGDKQRPSPASFMRELTEPSLFEPTRYGTLKGIQLAKAADLESVTPFIEKPPPDTHLVIVGEGLPNIPTFKKLLEKRGELVEFTPLKGAELARWTEKELRLHGITGASTKLVDRILGTLGEDPDGINKVIEKYALFLDGEAPTVDTLEHFLPHKSSANEFDLAETLIDRQRVVPEVLLQHLMLQGSSPFMLIGLLSKTFVTLFAIRFMLDKGVGNNDIRSSLQLSPWIFGKYAPLAKRLSLKRLGGIVRALNRADFSLKDKSLGVDAVMSSLAYRVSKSE